MRHFTRTPYYTGPDDPERGEVPGTLQLDETVIIETTGEADNDYEAAGLLKAQMDGDGDGDYPACCSPFPTGCRSGPDHGSQS